MPVEVRPGSLDDGAAVVELLASAVGGKDSRLDAALQRYGQDPTAKLLLAVLDGRIVGVAGYVIGDAEVTLLHIATAESLRRDGIGTKLVAAVAESTDRPLAAETDKTSVGFYRALGFTIESLGEKYPGVERFRAQRSPIR